MNVPFTTGAGGEAFEEPAVWQQSWVWDVGKQLLAAGIVLLLVLGVLGILCGLFTMLAILAGIKPLSLGLLIAGIACLVASLLFSLGELVISDHALSLELEDIERI